MKSQLKLKYLTPEEIAECTGGKIEYIGEHISEITSICNNSAEAEEGSMYVAIRGERFDGHSFICDSLANGAAAVLCDNLSDDIRDAGYNFAAVIVEDTVKALGALAAWYRSLSEAKFVAVTGSVGKTTTKEFIFSALSSGMKVHKSKGNYNNEIGLPMSLFEIEKDDQVSVLEMGMSNFGEISNMSKIVRPDIAVVTNIGTSHIASLGSRENICRAKLEILDGMNESGIIILNADEPLLFEKKGSFPCNTVYISTVNRYGDFRAVNARHNEDGEIYDLIYGDNAVTNVEIHMHGKHNVYNSLAAYAVGVELGLNDRQIRIGISNFVGVENRQNIYDVAGFTVIDDCYNASPESMRAAIDVLASVAAQKGVNACALLGDMLELGEHSFVFHEQLGQYAAAMKILKLYCYGNMADVIAEAAIKKDIRAHNVYVSVDTEKPELMAEMILDSMTPGDVLLVKASRGVKAEKVIECMKRMSKETRKKTPGKR